MKKEKRVKATIVSKADCPRCEHVKKSLKENYDVEVVDHTAIATRDDRIDIMVALAENNNALPVVKIGDGMWLTEVRI